MINTYDSVLKLLKDSIKQARQKASIVVNQELLLLYWEIGNTILEQQSVEGWGTKVIKRLATDLKSEFPDMRGLSERNLKYMRAFAETYPAGIVQAPLAQFPKVKESGLSSEVQAPLAQANRDQRKSLESKVDQIISLKKEDSAADTSALETEIDLIVYRLYKLTYEEVKIVDSAFGLSAGEYNQTNFDHG